MLHTLSRLSQTCRALKRCDPGFPVTDSSPSQDEEQIYKTLEDLVTEDQYADFFNKHLGGGGGNYGAVGGHNTMQYFNMGAGKV